MTAKQTRDYAETIHARAVSALLCTARAMTKKGLSRTELADLVEALGDILETSDVLVADCIIATAPPQPEPEETAS